MIQKIGENLFVFYKMIIRYSLRLTELISCLKHLLSRPLDTWTTKYL
ncbi:hypothetical protein X975_15757, partial [Stegodyphus mimosarum]